MAFLPENPNFEEGVYQLERRDKVQGGPDGTSNKPLRHLANRTRYLKERLDELSTQNTGHVGHGGDAHPAATTQQAGFMSAADKSKLDGIQAGAAPNAVTSVAGKTGAVTLSVGDVSGAVSGTEPTIINPKFAPSRGAGGPPTSPAMRVEGGDVDMRNATLFVGSPDFPGHLDDAYFPGGTHRGMRPDQQAANLRYVENAVKNTVVSINGKKGVIGKLAVADVEGAAPLNAPVFTGVAEFRNDVKGRTWQNTDNSPSLATTAWVRNAMPDIIDKAGYLKNFRAEPSGFIRLPSFLGGFTVQWIRHNAINNIARVNFPMAFANACLTAVIAPDNGSGRVYSVGTLDKSGCTVNRHHNGSADTDPLAFWCRIIAIGY